MRRTLFVTLAAALMLGAAGCKQKNPPRDQIPVLRERLAKVQETIKLRDVAQVDSLLSDQLRGDAHRIDSLYRFVYGADGSFPFYRFTNYEIVYNHDKARIDCELADSVGEKTLPVTLTFIYERSQWRLKRWEPRADSIQSSE